VEGNVELDVFWRIALTLRRSMGPCATAATMGLRKLINDQTLSVFALQLAVLKLGDEMRNTQGEVMCNTNIPLAHVSNTRA